MTKKLTLKQSKFKESILQGDNGTKAAIKAGYAVKSARVSAHRNITNHNIKAEIDKGIARIEAKTDVTIQEIINNARYLIELGISKKNGTDIAAGNKQLGEMIAAFKQVQQVEQVKPQVVLFKEVMDKGEE
ncbi:MAG: terminase small subunit [Patescibacteria group bacterium]|jgi:phage terminase small subunit